MSILIIALLFAGCASLLFMAGRASAMPSAGSDVARIMDTASMAKTHVVTWVHDIETQVARVKTLDDEVTRRLEELTR